MVGRVQRSTQATKCAVCGRRHLRSEPRTNGTAYSSEWTHAAHAFELRRRGHTQTDALREEQ